LIRVKLATISVAKIPRDHAGLAGFQSGIHPLFWCGIGAGATA
jgi:hypothetical protein